MITPIETLHALPRHELIALIHRAEVDRDNALFHARELHHAPIVDADNPELLRLMEIGRDVIETGLKVRAA